MAERRGTKALELWCRRMTEGYPGVKIDNMTTSWRDGLAFCAMIHHFRPDLIEFDKLTKSDVYYNNELAFTTAEKYLGIPALLDADDMAAYEVPDRLSILTYLSQFYQVFAAQDAHNRLKRSSPATTEKSPISKPPGPPPKMAHVVGVPKRDPCRKCQLPVFLAERLTVGKKIYHRTCLKCARCGSQLSPGSFYETEVDDAYCCETCPDEEVDSEIVLGANAVLMRGGTETPLPLPQSPRDDNAVGNTDHGRNVRSSIADRLAFFEKSKPSDTESEVGLPSSHKLLEKSVTDEEKSKSLQRFEDSTNKPYKMNTALSNFLNDAVEGDPAESELSSTADEKTEDTVEDTDNDESEDVEMEHVVPDQPPELPKSQPPPTPSKIFTATAQLQMGSSTARQLADDETDAVESADTEIRNKTEIKLNLLAANNNESPCTEHEPETERQKLLQQQQHQDNNQVDTELSGNINKNCITKDNAGIIDTTAHADNASPTAETTDKNDSSEHITGDGVEVQLREKPLESLGEDAETTERLSVVRARLQQFEVIANVTNNNNNHQLNDTTPQSIPEKEIKENKQEIDTTVEDQHVQRVTEKVDSVQQEEIKDPQCDDIAPIKEKQEELDPLKEDVNIVEDNVEINNLEQEQQQKEVTFEITEKIIKGNQETGGSTEEHLKMETEDSGMRESESKLDENQIEVEVVQKEHILCAEEPLSSSILEEERVPSPIPKTQPVPTEEEHSLPDSSNTSSTTTLRKYPEDLNPFASDDDEDNDVQVQQGKENCSVSIVAPQKSAESLNPFDSSDDEIELEKSAKRSSLSTPLSQTKIPPPRPPPPRISRNPFGDEEDDKVNLSRGSSLNSSINRRTPVPTPRTNVSQNPTPEPTPRLSTKGVQHSPATLGILQNSSDYYGSANSLSSTAGTPLHRNSEFRGSNNSLTSSAGGTVRMRKVRKAPAPPPPVKELFPSTETINSSRTSTPSSSTVGTPKSGRKKRLAPAPPKPARLDASVEPPQIVVVGDLQHNNPMTPPKNLYSYPLQSELDSKLSDEEKALLEGKQTATNLMAVEHMNTDRRRNSRRLIPLDDSLLEEMNRDRGERVNKFDEDSQCDDLKEQQNQHDHQKYLKSFHSYAGDSEEAVVYRRVLIPPMINTPTHESNPLLDDLNAAHRDRQLEKLKDNKEANNRNRQSQISAASSGTDDCDPTALYNKSSHGKWKRRKGPAPALPVPPRKVLQMLPLQEIRHELEIIEVQQLGLEKQGVILEKMIRDRCENERGEPLPMTGAGGSSDGTDESSAAKTVADSNQNSKEVEDLILQLFELVNEKNELFRRQAELMYLRRQHRLEQEQADLEYEIRVLMAQPERNKTDSDKAREEALIARLVEVVQLRNEVVECLEMDRLREAEEDLSIKQRLELHTSKRNESDDGRKTSASTAKLSKKEKRKQKESKKLSKNKKIDADKDADETELESEKQKLKKKKKKFLF